ncbi:MAG TPA: alpha/beta hydrolase [Acidimicrobiales bacterium]|nr:alpha/beta hydrolase [Acidimicrobiales bacterium]
MREQNRSFVYRGDRLVYDTYGEGDRLLVYLHGLLIDSELNRGIAEALAARGNRVVLLDLLGHGRSDKPRHASAYRIDTYPSQVFALLDELGVEDAVLGGMSLGANVSLFAAAQQPERVRGLVIEMPVLERAVPFAAMLFIPLLLLAHYGQPVLRVTSAALRRVPPTRSGVFNGLVHGASLPPDSMAALLHGILVGPVSPTQEQRSGIAVPTLVLAHRNDLLHPFDDAVNLAVQLPDATLVRARSPLELRRRPVRLTDAIANFLDAAWGPGDADAERRSGAEERASPVTRVRPEEIWDGESGRAV